jgi:hypothetical protein
VAGDCAIECAGFVSRPEIDGVTGRRRFRVDVDKNGFLARYKVASLADKDGGV